MKNKGNLTLNSLPEVLTAKNIADYLGISRRRVYELFKQNPTYGGIPNFEIGNSKRVQKEDFVAWVIARKEEKKKQFA